MIRTSFSFLILCTSLFVASKLVHESIAAEKPSVQAGRSGEPSISAGAPYIAAFQLDTSNNASARAPEDLTLAPANNQPSSNTRDSLTDDIFELEPVNTTAEQSTTEQQPADETLGEEKAADEGSTEPSQDTEPSSTAAKATEATVLTPELAKLREDVRDCLGYYYNRYHNVVDHSPWGVMHVLIAYGVDTEVLANNRKVNAIGWLCWNGTCRGQQLFYVNRGKIDTRIGPGVQGHDGQFLAMLAQSRVKSNYPMRVDGEEFTVADLIEHEKETCEAGTELTFKLIGLAHYLDSEATWTARTGEQWSIARLIKEELAQPVVGAACGGTHRMMGFTYAVQKRQKEGLPIKGQWQRAKKFLDDYFDYTFYLQNEDGSFSTDFFRGKNSYGDINRRIETTGHILEWFVASLSDEQLRDPRVIKSVRYLTDLMMENRDHDWEIGPKGHALHALAIYSERVFQDKPGQRESILARGRRLSLDSHQR